MRIRERFNPRAPCGARPARHQARLFMGGISTHAPLAGRDSVVKFNNSFHLNFNPRAPCGARQTKQKSDQKTKIFQPTRPLRGATQIAFLIHVTTVIFQPTRPLRGATNVSPNQSIIAVFQPTRPLRGATRSTMPAIAMRTFQPTRPLRGATTAHRKPLPDCLDFNPRAPCGARRRKLSKGQI